MQSKGMLTTCDLQGANPLMNSDFSVWRRGLEEPSISNEHFDELHGTGQMVCDKGRFLEQLW